MLCQWIRVTGPKKKLCIKKTVYQKRGNPTKKRDVLCAMPVDSSDAYRSTSLLGCGLRLEGAGRSREYRLSAPGNE